MENETRSVGTGAIVVRQWLAILIAVAVLGLPANADRGNDAYKHGLRAERQTKYDDAYAYYKQAFTLTPNNPKYMAAYTRMRVNASMQRVHAGQLLRSSGALADALTEFQHAAEIDSSSFIAQQELRRTADMLRRQERQKSAPKVEPPLAKLDDLSESVVLQPLSNAPITLHLTVTADAAYKTIGKLAGLNVLIDPEFRPQKMTLDLTNVTIREALDMVRLQSKSFWRPVLANTIFVAADTPAKRKELEQNVMRTFYLRNVTTPTELQDAANVVRQILDVSRVQLLPAQDAMIVRGTQDQMVLIEKVLADVDKPKAEVLIDIAVMEVSRDRIKTIGTTVPTSVSVGILPGGGGGSSGANGGFKVGSFVFSVPGGSFSMLASDSNTKLLQNPQIRAVNNEKSTLRIGDRVPIATGSFQPGMVGGGGVSPLVSTQFQYLDVGVNIDITPHIHSDNEVTLKMALEISSVTGQTTIGGITQPIIGQRRIEHETRLADGEINLLGGILEDTETQSMSGYPWISKIPILKYLFAQDNKEHRENEIVFAITPHIMRAKEVNDDNLRVVEVGTGNSIELRWKPPASPAPGAEHKADPAKPQQTTPQAAPPSAPSAPGAAHPGTPSSQANPQSKPAGPG